MRVAIQVARFAVATIVLGATTAAELRAQSFEVVSIKRAGAISSPFRGMRLQGNRWIAVRITARELVQEAYKAEGMKTKDRVVGGSSWLDSEQFDIVATVAPGSPPEQVALMIQRMLVQRFALAFHTERREFRTMELVLANGKGQLGPQVRRVQPDCGAAGAPEVRGRSAQAPQAVTPRCGIATVFGPPNRLVARSAPMAELASRLTQLLALQVADGTGLSGAFDFDLVYMPDGSPSATSDSRDAPPGGGAPGLSTALREQLGLQIAPRRELLDVMLIDRMERPSDD